MKVVKLKDAGKIHPDERDYNLHLHTKWPPENDLQNWSIARGSPSLRRQVIWKQPDDENEPDFLTFAGLEKKAIEFDERMLCFPSAPIYHTHRKQEYAFPLNDRVNYHTLRLIRPIRDSSVITDIYRIVIFHNGLNELDDLAFYYKLAALLTSEDEHCACLIRPFPGHLTRHPIGGDYAERPLDRYLLDPGDLFRQFLRFMLETQWLFSVLVPHSDYRVVSGLNLLAPGKRHEDAAVAEAIGQSYLDAFLAESPDLNGLWVCQDSIQATVTELRDMISVPRERPDPERPPSRPLRPAIHNIGYSLGGFLAQAVFFTWPFAVSSATTICSGGALRDVSLTAFAHPEEWRSVMHALRYELESSMVDGRIKYAHRDDEQYVHRNDEDKGEKAQVCGIEKHEFSCFYQMFHDVFVREFEGLYGSRVSEYIARLLFVVGGRDPIISAASVLDASPPEGINLLQVANLSHFPDRGDLHWQSFWLPEVARLINRLARRSEDLLDRVLGSYWWNSDRTDLVSVPPKKRGIELFRENPKSRSHFDEGTGDQALANEAFQVELDDICQRFCRWEMHDEITTARGGWLYIIRNEVPAAFLGEKILHLRGRSLHHSDELIWAYLDCLRMHREQLKASSDRLTMVIPEPWGRLFVSEQAMFSPKTEAFMFKIPSRETLKAIRADFYTTWGNDRALHHFSPSAHDPPAINTLPDVWIWFSQQVVDDQVGKRAPSNRAETALGEMYDRLNLEKDRTKGTWKTLINWIADGEIRIIKVSRGEFNQRFRAWRVTDVGRAWKFLRHAAKAVTLSDAKPHPNLADFMR